MKNAFAQLIIRSVLVCYGVWGGVIVADLASCEVRFPGKCESQRAELRGVAATVPATLLAWLSESPMKP